MVIQAHQDPFIGRWRDLAQIVDRADSVGRVRLLSRLSRSNALIDQMLVYRFNQPYLNGIEPSLANIPCSGPQRIMIQVLFQQLMGAQSQPLDDIYAAVWRVYLVMKLKHICETSLKDENIDVYRHVLDRCGQIVKNMATEYRLTIFELKTNYALSNRQRIQLDRLQNIQTLLIPISVNGFLEHGVYQLQRAMEKFNAACHNKYERQVSELLELMEVDAEKFTSLILALSEQDSKQPSCLEIPSNDNVKHMAR